MIFSKSGTAKINIDELVNGYIESNRVDELLLIVPTKRKVRQLKKQLIDLSNGRLNKINVETLSTFSSNILKESEQFVELNEATSSILIAKASKEIELQYFSKNKGELPKGTLDKLRNLFSEYKKMGIWPSDFEKLLHGENDIEKLKAADILNIYKIYLESCYKINALEVGDIYQRVNLMNLQLFTANLKKCYNKVNLAVIYGFDEFTKPEIDLISKISEVLNDKLFVELDYFNFNPKLFAHLKKNHDLFLEMGFSRVKDLKAETETGFKKRVKSKLFIPVLGKDIEQKKYNIKKAVCKDRYEEVEFISKEIKNLVKDKSVKPSDIAVVFNLIDNYSDIIRDIFSEYELPFNLSDRLTLKATRPVNDLLNFLYIIEDDYYYQSILRAVNGSFINLKIENKQALKHFFSENEFIRGRGFLFSLLNETEKNDKLQLSDAVEGIKIIDNLIADFRKKLTFEEFYDALVKLSRELEIPAKILESEEYAEANTKGFTYFFEVLNEVFFLLKKEYGPEKKHDLQFFIEQIRIILNWARYNVKEKSEYGIQVTTLDEIRGLKYKYLFIGGMVDGDLPLKYTPEIFVSPEIKKRRQAFHLTKQRYLFYQALSAWSYYLYFTVPQYDESNDLSESVFMKEFENYFEPEIIATVNYKRFIYSKYKSSENLIRDEIKPPGLNREEDIVKEYFGKLKEDVYSASQLELYARCSYKYFIERVLKIKALEVPDEEVDRRDLGSKLHNVLSEFYKWVLASKINMLKDKEKAKQKLIELADEEFAEYEIFDSRAFIEKEKIYGADNNFENSILGKFLEHESECDSVPYKLEYSFGYDDNPIELNGIKIRGRVDRIDIKEGSFEIIDYKLNGKKPTTDEVIEAVSIQLPLYAFALEKGANEIFGEEYKPGGMIIFSLNLKDFGKKEVKQRGKQSSEFITSIKDEFLEKVKDYVDKLSEGIFELSGLKDRETKICRFCKLDSICRIKEVDK